MSIRKLTMNFHTENQHVIILPFEVSKTELRNQYQTLEFHSSWWSDDSKCDEQIFKKAAEIGFNYAWKIVYESQDIDTFLNLTSPGWLKRLTRGKVTKYDGSPFPERDELLSLKQSDIKNLRRGWTLLVNK